MRKPQYPSIQIVAVQQPFAAFEPRRWQPPLNVYETEQAVVLIVELAGVDPAEIEIDVQPTCVGVRGTRQLALPPALRRLHRMEIASGSFHVEVPLATPIDSERAEAHCRNGLLEVRLPFAEPVVQRVVVHEIREGDVQ